MNGQGIFYDDPARSPGAQHRQTSRQAAPFESYARGNMNGNAYFNEEPETRFDVGRGGLDRLNSSMQNGGGYNTFDQVASQTWNPQAFANNSNNFSANAFAPSSRTTRPAQQQSRRNLPAGWMEPQMNLPQSNGFGGMGPPSIMPSMPRDAYQSDIDDELIPTAIVIKNIPFAVRKEELVDVMTSLNLPLPYAFNYHFDNGVFRGLAFANFTSSEETAIVIDALNHFELNGRKLRVEYKKMLPQQERERIEREKRERRGQLEEQHRPMATPSLHNPPSMSSLASSRINATSPSPVEQRNGRPGMPAMATPSLGSADSTIDLNDPQTLSFYSEIMLFKNDPAREMIIFPSTLTAVQRRTVHTLSHMMALSHESNGSGDQRQVYVRKLPPGNNVSPPLSQTSMLQPDANRRTLNRAATTDFSENRAMDANAYQNLALRGQHSTGFLGLPESPGGFGNSNNLRGAKSFADLRSYTPSPAQSAASYPNPHQMPRINTEGSNGTPNLTPTTSNNPLLQHPQQQRSNNILDLAGMSLNDPMGPSGSPRRPRQMFSWDRETGGPGNPSPAPIGSNRGFGSSAFADDGNGRMPVSQMPLRQPRGPAPERAPGFARPRQNGHGLGHQQRGSDELSQGGQQQGRQVGQGVEIIVEQ